MLTTLALMLSLSAPPSFEDMFYFTPDQIDPAISYAHIEWKARRAEYPFASVYLTTAFVQVDTLLREGDFVTTDDEIGTVKLMMRTGVCGSPKWDYLRLVTRIHGRLSECRVADKRTACAIIARVSNFPRVRETDLWFLPEDMGRDIDCPGGGFGDSGTAYEMSNSGRLLSFSFMSAFGFGPHFCGVRARPGSFTQFVSCPRNPTPFPV